LKDLDFSTVSIGTQTGASVLLKNESNADVDIKSIHSQNNTQEFKIISNPPIPKTLIPGDTIHIMITFTPSEVKDYLDSIIVETGKPCQNIFIRKIKGNGIGGGKTTIWLPDTLAHVGDVDYCIPFMAKNDDTIKINQALNFTAEIRYDVTALFPDTDFPVVAGERIISLKGSNILLQNKELELDNFCGKIFLPNLDRTLLRITKFEWSNPKIEKTIKDGSLTVNGVCQQTITRIRMFTPLTLEVSPNPANELIITYYNLPKEGLVKLTLVSFLGQEIAVLINEEQKPGEHNCVLIIDNYGLVEGLYFLKLVTSGEAITEKVFIIK